MLKGNGVIIWSYMVPLKLIGLPFGWTKIGKLFLWCKQHWLVWRNVRHWHWLKIESKSDDTNPCHTWLRYWFFLDQIWCSTLLFNFASCTNNNYKVVPLADDVVSFDYIVLNQTPDKTNLDCAIFTRTLTAWNLCGWLWPLWHLVLYISQFVFCWVSGHDRCVIFLWVRGVASTWPIFNV